MNTKKRQFGFVRNLSLLLILESFIFQFASQAARPVQTQIHRPPVQYFRAPPQMNWVRPVPRAAFPNYAPPPYWSRPAPIVPVPYYPPAPYWTPPAPMVTAPNYFSPPFTAAAGSAPAGAVTENASPPASPAQQNIATAGQANLPSTQAALYFIAGALLAGFVKIVFGTDHLRSQAAQGRRRSDDCRPRNWEREKGGFERQERERQFRTDAANAARDAQRMQQNVDAQNASVRRSMGWE